MTETALMRWLAGVMTALIVAAVIGLFTMSRDLAVLVDRSASATTVLNGHEARILDLERAR